MFPRHLSGSPGIPVAFTRALREDREKDGDLTNPAFPRDRGDIHERESAGTERQTATQRGREREGGKEREGGSAVSLSIPPVGSGSPTLTAAHYTTAERALCPSETHATSQRGGREMNE